MRRTPLARAFMADLEPRFTFETFVVGPANRLASAAARRAADSPGQSYNPLFIYSASGLGKSHILGAIAHHAQRADSNRTILYEPLEQYIDSLTAALERGEQDKLRERYRNLDVLLMDDVQFLAGQPEAQEILLSTVDALTAATKQVVLASDRPPAEINGLDARLVSRFSGGLIVDIGAPEFETRMAIVQRKAEEQGQTLVPAVAEAIGRVPFKNVRELSGALNRILAIQDLEGRVVSASEVPELLGVQIKVSRKADEFGTFMSEIAGDVENVVVAQEEPWRKALREAAEAADREGFRVAGLRGLLESEEAPDDWEEKLEAFKGYLARLRAIEEELDGLDAPWSDETRQIVRDPDRLEEAEALLASVQERRRPFRRVVEGPDLAGLNGLVPSLAIRAAEQLVDDERPKYNPLFFWGEPDYAGRALLAATSRTYRSRHPEARNAVTSVSEFSADFVRALSEGVAGAWRERWWTVDLLLVHGLEELSETERAQDEFFHMFEALKRRGARLFLLADRPPQSMQDIDERLRSRFEGGLVLQVNAEGPIAAPLADLDLVDEEDPSADVAERTGEHEALGPLEEIGPQASSAAAEEAQAAAQDDRPEASEGARVPAGNAWIPSREKVVWNWPSLDDRLLEDLD